MSDFPVSGSVIPTGRFITPYDENAIGADIMALIGGTGASNTIAQNRRYYFPFSLEEDFSCAALGVMNGATVGGNWDVGIFDLSGTMLAHTGSVAQSGTSVPQIAATSGGTVVIPGGDNYMLAFVSDSATATFFRGGPSLHLINGKCGRQDTATGLPLATGASFTAPTSSHIIYCFACEGTTL